jgi:hypothetical protein
MQPYEHLDPLVGLGAGQPSTELMSRSLDVREHSHRVAGTEPADGFPGRGWRRCEHELKSAVTERDRCVEGTPQSLECGIPVGAKVTLLVQLVDAYPTTGPGVVGGQPMMAAEAHRRVRDVDEVQTQP